MKYLIQVTIFIILIGCSLDHEHIKEASHFLNMLKAVKNSSISDFKSCYSKNIVNDKTQNDWEKNISEAKQSLNKYFGEFNLNDFYFKTNKSKDKLSIIHKGKFKLQLSIIFEDNSWKLNQR